MLIDYNQIIPDRLWVGSVIRPGDAKQLRRMGITTVVSLQTDKDLKQYGITPEKLVKALDEANIEYRRVPVQDFDKEDLARQLPKCVSEIESALAPGWAKVYLHCTLGILRSPTAAAAYLIKTNSLPAQKAYELLMEKRDCNPDIDILGKYEATLQMTNEKSNDE
jgi:protein-tyrosine phosphatase